MKFLGPAIVVGSLVVPITGAATRTGTPRERVDVVIVGTLRLRPPVRPHDVAPQVLLEVTDSLDTIRYPDETPLFASDDEVYEFLALDAPDVTDPGAWSG